MSLFQARCGAPPLSALARVLARARAHTHLQRHMVAFAVHSTLFNTLAVFSVTNSVFLYTKQRNALSGLCRVPQTVTEAGGASRPPPRETGHSTSTSCTFSHVRIYIHTYTNKQHVLRKTCNIHALYTPCPHLLSPPLFLRGAASRAYNISYLRVTIT